VECHEQGDIATDFLLTNFELDVQKQCEAQVLALNMCRLSPRMTIGSDIFRALFNRLAIVAPSC
jgi:hypothetical protein